MCVNCFCNKTSVLKSFLQQKVCVDCICNKKVCVSNLRFGKIWSIFCKVSKPNYCSKKKWECFGLWSQFILWDILKSLKKHVRNCLTIQNNWRLSGNFWHNQKKFWIIKTFRTIRKIFRQSRNFPGYPETFRTIRKISGLSVNLSRLSGNFPDHSENIRTIRKLSRLSENFPGYPETFLNIWKISGLSGNFLGYSELFWTIRKISRLSGNFPDYL